MRLRTVGLMLAAVGLGVFIGPGDFLRVSPAAVAGPASRADELGDTDAARLPPVPVPAAEGLPPLPERSPRNASYTIEAHLDPATRTLEGRLVLEWTHPGGEPVDSFPFHLYWNAFRNNLSTTARVGTRRWSGRDLEPGRFGWIEVRSVRLLGEVEEDLTPSLRYVHPDGNEDDRTVVEVRTTRGIAAGETARFRLEWEALVPHGSVGRAGWVHDHHFIVQWFPKIGVYRDGEWSAHPFYAWTEFFADFGVYDVRLTLPRGNVVGATGRLEEKTENPDGTETWHFRQEDVHDFAWTASPRYHERRAVFDEPGYPVVEIRLLLQPEHAHLAERHIEATKIALRTYGTWSAPYPYPHITVVDPAWGSASGGMEYPTLFTVGTNVFAPPELQEPEGLVIHEAGHQFWYGLVANDEREEAWLDEGFNSYMTSKALAHAFGARGWERRYFGGDLGRGARTGWPLVAPEVWLLRGSERLPDLRRSGAADVMARPGWTYRTRDSYTVNAYDKPALVLQTLEGLLGEERMIRVLRTYARRHRFAHPTTEDFIRTVEEVTGEDWRSFFDETFFSSHLCDYAVEVAVEAPPTPAGWFEGPDGTLVLKPSTGEPAHGGGGGAGGDTLDSTVTIVRRGGVRVPVDVRVDFADGGSVTESWDGRDRWTRFRYSGAGVVRAVVDPHAKIAIDVDRVNNEWVASRGPAHRAATKWAARWMLWLQDLLELHMVLG